MKFERELLRGVAPIVTLEVLSRGAMYGYELGEALEKRSAGILTLGRGTLYPLLYNLEAKGLIQGQWKEGDTGRNRRYYSITGKGRAHLARQRQQWQRLQQGVDTVFGAPSPLGRMIRGADILSASIAAVHRCADIGFGATSAMFTALIVVVLRVALCGQA